MPLHSIFGYAVAGLAALGLLLAIAAHRRRSAAASKLMFGCFIACGVVQIPALVTGVIDNAAITTAASVAPYNVFIGASFFTLTSILVVWRWWNPEVAWENGQEVDFEITDEFQKIIKHQLKRLNDGAMLAQEHITIYEMFVEGKDADKNQ